MSVCALIFVEKKPQKYMLVHFIQIKNKIIYKVFSHEIMANRTFM